MSKSDRSMLRRDWCCEDVLSGNLEVSKVREDERVLAFHHPYPQDEVHFVVIPKDHGVSILDSLALDGVLLISTLLAVQKTARVLKLDETGFYVRVNAAAPGVTSQHALAHSRPGNPVSRAGQGKIVNLDQSLLAVFAHPDDETFRPGGTLALLSQRGVQVQVVSATRGVAGSCGHPQLRAPDELPALRESELHCAWAALGIESPILLDYPNGRLSDVNPETLLAEILVVMQRVQPQVMVSFGPDWLSGHPDHIDIGCLASEALHRSVDVVALSTLAVPPLCQPGWV